MARLAVWGVLVVVLVAAGVALAKCADESGNRAALKAMPSNTLCIIIYNSNWRVLTSVQVSSSSSSYTSSSLAEAPAFVEYYSNSDCYDGFITSEACSASSPSSSATSAPTQPPTTAPTHAATKAPTKAPTQAPTQAPTKAPTKAPTQAPTKAPTKAPTQAPTQPPTQATTQAPTQPPAQTCQQSKRHRRTIVGGASHGSTCTVDNNSLNINAPASFVCASIFTVGDNGSWAWQSNQHISNGLNVLHLSDVEPGTRVAVELFDGTDAKGNCVQAKRAATIASMVCSS